MFSSAPVLLSEHLSPNCGSRSGAKLGGRAEGLVFLSVALSNPAESKKRE